MDILTILVRIQAIILVTGMFGVGGADLPGRNSSSRVLLGIGVDVICSILKILMMLMLST